jgi:hypothetical protein
MAKACDGIREGAVARSTFGSEIRPQIDPVIILVSQERQSAERKYIKLNQITED